MDALAALPSGSGVGDLASLTELWDLFVSSGGERSPVHDHWPLETAADAMRGSFDRVHVNAIDYVVDVPAAEPAGEPA